MKRNDEMKEHLKVRRFQGGLATVLAAGILFSISSCKDIDYRRELAQQMAAQDNLERNDEDIAKLKAEIRSTHRQVERTLEAVRKQGTYWRLLGLKYMDYQMWGQAIKAFDEAVAIYPEHAALLYNRALCAGQMALAADQIALQEAYIDRAEAGYRRAIAVDPRYTSPKYALAVLLIFEKNNPFEASMLLEDFLAIERSDIPARFLLARSYLELGRDSDALDLYEQIIRTAGDPSDVAQAEELSVRVAGGNYGF